jgi:hypothetical protein
MRRPIGLGAAIQLVRLILVREAEFKIMKVFVSSLWRQPHFIQQSMISSKTLQIKYAGPPRCHLPVSLVYGPLLASVLLHLLTPTLFSRDAVPDASASTLP